MKFAEQGSGAWLNMRVGRLTASRMADAMAMRKDGKPSESRNKLLVELLAERLTGDATPHFVSAPMLWGIEQEPHAKAAYEAASGTLLDKCGFSLHPEIEHFGASPDAHIGDDTVFEAKCPNSTTHVSWLIERKMPEQHKPQVLAQLACTGRSVAVFVSFDPRMPPNKQLMIVDWLPTREEIEHVEECARNFLSDLDSMFRQLTEAA